MSLYHHPNRATSLDRISVGDISIDDDDIFGDAVNVAAWLQTLASRVESVSAPLCVTRWWDMCSKAMCYAAAMDTTP